jgi:hypothetical protein
MSLAFHQHPLVEDTVGPQCSIRIEVFAINRVPAQVADIARSAFHYSVDVLPITRSGSDQFHARLWLNNATPRPPRAVNDGYSFGVNQGLAGESYVIWRRCSKTSGQR